jgi:predicted nucleic acid-binding protein
MLRAVLDTNVVLAAKGAKSVTSPNAEILTRWGLREFDWLISDDTLEEYLEKLLERGHPRSEVIPFIAELVQLGVHVPIRFFHLRHYPCEADDTAFLLVALNGQGSHLVTYDEDLANVSVFYPEFVTCRPLEFLAALRGHP